MAWIDYTKTYDLVPHSRIIEGLDLFGVAENIKEFASEQYGKVQGNGNSELGEVRIKACVCYFYEIFIFSPNDSPSKTMKNVFHFI